MTSVLYVGKIPEDRGFPCFSTVPDWFDCPRLVVGDGGGGEDKSLQTILFGVKF